jgi:hypothetical protein
MAGEDISVAGAGPLGVGVITPVVVRSKDEGRTWQDVSPSLVPTLLGDPYMHLDRDTGRVFVSELGSTLCQELWFSDDAGDTWTPNPSVCGLSDHQNIFTAPPVHLTTAGYPNVVYLCAIAAGLGSVSASDGCLRSLDGGLTFVLAGAPPFPTSEAPAADGGLGQGVGGPDGAIYLPKGWNGVPYLAVSRDEGLTWARHRVADSRMPSEDGHLAHQASVAVDAAGNLFYAWVGERSAPLLAVSRDGGSTWSRPMTIGPPGLALASLAAIDAGRRGSVAISYMGFASGGRGWHGYLTVSANALSARPLFYSASVNPPSDPLVGGACGPIRCQGAGDFFDVAIGPDGTPWASFVDTCRPGCTVEPGTSEGVVGRLVGGPRLR